MCCKKNGAEKSLSSAFCRTIKVSFFFKYKKVFALGKW